MTSEAATYANTVFPRVVNLIEHPTATDAVPIPCLRVQYAGEYLYLPLQSPESQALLARMNAYTEQRQTRIASSVYVLPWTSGITYAIHDVVTFCGDWFVCRSEHVADVANAPLTTNASWVQCPACIMSDVDVAAFEAAAKHAWNICATSEADAYANTVFPRVANLIEHPNATEVVPIPCLRVQYASEYNAVYLPIQSPESQALLKHMNAYTEQCQTCIASSAYVLPWTPRVTYAINAVVTFCGGWFVCRSEHVADTSNAPTASAFWVRCPAFSMSDDDIVAFETAAKHAWNIYVRATHIAKIDDYYYIKLNENLSDAAADDTLDSSMTYIPCESLPGKVFEDCMNSCCSVR